MYTWQAKNVAHPSRDKVLTSIKLHLFLEAEANSVEREREKQDTSRKDAESKKGAINNV